MAYSSISHMGFALMGLAAGTVEGAQALLIYLAIYVTMNVGVFAFILNMERDGKPVTDIYALGLYSRVEPARAAALAVLLFSLAGVPPLVGFFGKFYVLMAAVRGRAGLAGGRRRGRERDRRVLLPADRLPHVLRRGGRSRSTGGCRRCTGRCSRSRRWPWCSASSTCSGSRGSPPPPRRRSSSSDARPGRRASAARSTTMLDSTNAEALRRAAAGEAGPLWILARQPDRGARPARAGLGGAGGQLRGDAADAGRPATRALRSFVAALGLYDAMVAVTGRPELFALKWPNDVLLVGRQARRHPARGGERRRARRRRRGQPRDARRSPATLEAGAVPPVSLREATGLAVDARGLPRPARAGGRRAGRTGWPTRASRRCAPPGWPGRRGSASRSSRGCPDRDARPGASRPSTRRGALVLATADGPRGAAGRRHHLRRGRRCCSPLTSATPTWCSRCTTARRSSPSGAAAPSASAPPTNTTSGCGS